MSDQKQPIDSFLYGLAFLLAFAIRLINLGAASLTDFESTWALQALHTSQGNHLLLGSQTAYVQLTGLFFNLFGSSDFIARLWPALFGSLLVLIPILLAKWLGRIPTLILVFALAVDPGLVAISRQAGGPVIALAGGLLALACWFAGKHRWAGIFLGVGLLSGDSIWACILGLSITLLLMRWLDRPWWEGFRMWLAPSKETPVQSEENDAEIVSSENKPPAWNLKISIYFAIGTILAVGTMVFIRPMGLSGLAGGLTSYLTGWGSPSDVSFVRLLVALLAYEPIALILGVWGGIRGWRNKEPLDQFLGLWAGVSLILALIYPARQVDSLAWTIIPLWVLAVREGLRHVKVVRAEALNTLNQGILTFVIFVFIWFNLQGIANLQISGGNPSPQLTAIGVAAAILIFASILISWGWSKAVAGRGLVWGGFVFFVIYTFALTTSAGGVRLNYTSELWTRGGSLPQVSYLINTINELSDTHTGVANNLDVVVVGVPSPGLEWALRRFPNPVFTTELAVGTKPSIVITPEQTELSLAASYRGDAFNLVDRPDWSLILPNEYLPWFVFHSAPQQIQSVIVWARVDLFPGGTLSSTNPTP